MGLCRGLDPSQTGRGVAGLSRWGLGGVARPGSQAMMDAPAALTEEQEARLQGLGTPGGLA